MKYYDGSPVKVGDKVQLWSGCRGVVVCSFDTGEFSDEYGPEEWAYLKKGVLILSEEAGLVHYEVPDEDLELLERCQA